MITEACRIVAGEHRRRLVTPTLLLLLLYQSCRPSPQMGYLSGGRHLCPTSIRTRKLSGPSVRRPTGSMLRARPVTYLLSVVFFSPGRPYFREQSPPLRLCGSSATSGGVSPASGCLEAASQNSNLPSLSWNRLFLPQQATFPAACTSVAPLCHQEPVSSILLASA